MFTEIADGLFTLERELRFGFGMTLTTRMSVVRRDRVLWVHSPLPGDDWYDAIADLGEVRFLIAPSYYHCSFIAAAKERFPNALLTGPADMTIRRPKVPIDLELAECQGHPAWPQGLLTIPLGGVPTIAEHLFYDQQSRSLLLTDLIFHNERGANLITRILLGLFAPTGRPSRSREWAWLVKDREAFANSLEVLDSLKIDRVVGAHGRIIDDAPLALALMRTGRSQKKS